MARISYAFELLCCWLYHLLQQGQGDEVAPVSHREEARLQAWIRAIKRKDWQPNQHSMVCSLHFISGKPSTDMGSPDYVPSIFAYNSEKDESKMARHQRLVNWRTSIVEPEHSSHRRRKMF